MENSSSPPVSPKKPSSVRHTRAIQRDRSKRPIVTAPDLVVAEHLRDLVHPLTLSQVAHFHDLGLRERTLTLPVMVALRSVRGGDVGKLATLYGRHQRPLFNFFLRLDLLTLRHQRLAQPNAGKQFIVRLLLQMELLFPLPQDVFTRGSPSLLYR